MVAIYVRWIKAGKLTMAKLKELLEDDEPEEDTEVDKTTTTPVEPQDPNVGNVAHRPLTIEQRVMQLEFAVFGMEFGGESDG